MAVDLSTEVSNPELAEDGAIVVSAEARRRLGLLPGMGLAEFVVDGCLVYVPDGVLIERSLRRIHAWLDEQGLNSEDLLVGLDAIRDEVFAEFYPELAKR